MYECWERSASSWARVRLILACSLKRSNGYIVRPSHSLNRLPLPAGERVGERAEKEVHVLLTNACLWLGNQSNLSAWGALWICSRRPPAPGSAARSTGRRRGRDGAGRRWLPAGTCSLALRPAAVRTLPPSC